MLETPTVRPSGANGYTASFGSDRNLFVEFYQDAVLNEFKSNEEGRPIYEEVDKVRILMPGNKSTAIETVKTKSDAAGPSHIERFPAQWEAYKAQKEQIPNGTPLSEWPAITKAHALNYRGLKIYTVEQLADIPDNNIDMLGMGGRVIRDKAKTWLARSIDTGEISRLFARIEALETDNSVLKEQLKTASETKSKKLTIGEK